VVVAIAKDLFQKRTKQPSAELRALHRSGVDRRVVGDRTADDLVHHEHPAARQRRMDDRDPHASIGAVALGQPQTRRDLTTVVELRFDAGDQLVGEVSYPDPAGRFDASIELPRDKRKYSGVSSDDPIDARPLHLDDHGAPVVEACAVRLTNRCRRKRIVAERGECLLDWLTELGAQDLLYLLGPQACDVRVQI
jgi:hypothetical protein